MAEGSTEAAVVVEVVVVEEVAALVAMFSLGGATVVEVVVKVVVAIDSPSSSLAPTKLDFGNPKSSQVAFSLATQIWMAFPQFKQYLFDSILNGCRSDPSDTNSPDKSSRSYA